jgi:hypothetical protein
MATWFRPAGFRSSNLLHRHVRSFTPPRKSTAILESLLDTDNLSLLSQCEVTHPTTCDSSTSALSTLEVIPSTTSDLSASESTNIPIIRAVDKPSTSFSENFARGFSSY